MLSVRASGRPGSGRRPADELVRRHGRGARRAGARVGCARSARGRTCARSRPSSNSSGGSHLQVIPGGGFRVRLLGLHEDRGAAGVPVRRQPGPCGQVLPHARGGQLRRQPGVPGLLFAPAHMFARQRFIHDVHLWAPRGLRCMVASGRHWQRSRSCCARQRRARRRSIRRPLRCGRSCAGRPRGRLRAMTAPRSKISPPQTPHGSRRSSAPARQARRAGQSRHSALAAPARPGRRRTRGRRPATRQGTSSGHSLASGSSRSSLGSIPKSPARALVARSY